MANRKYALSKDFNDWNRANTQPPDQPINWELRMIKPERLNAMIADVRATFPGLDEADLRPEHLDHIRNHHDLIPAPPRPSRLTADNVKIWVFGALILFLIGYVEVCGVREGFRHGKVWGMLSLFPPVAAWFAVKSWFG
jgi:hypothetical protein